MERGLPATTPPFIKHMLRLAQSERSLFAGNPTEALKYARESILLAEAKDNIVAGWISVAKAASGGGAEVGEDPASVAIEAYNNAMSAASVSSGSVTDVTQLVAPLEAYLRSSKILVSFGQYDNALGVLLAGARAYSSPSLFLLIGVCCLRLERWVDAEDALQESNLLDCRRADVWAFLSLLCLGSGAHRLTEADRATEQALRLGLQDASVLRELAMGYVAVDQLQVAEDLIRRALASEMREKGYYSSYTRKLLGDVLAGQHAAAAAVEEYQSVIGDDSADSMTRVEAAVKCSSLLKSLGRMDEVRSVEEIADVLRAAGRNT